MNLYVTLKIKLWRFYVSNGCTLQNSLFEAVVHIGFTLRAYLFRSVKLTQNAYPDKYFYSGYGVSFELCGMFLVAK